MSKTDLTQKLKISSVSVDLTTGTWSTPFPIGLAKDEILLIHASKATIHRTAAGGYNARLFLYKKTENVPTTSAWSGATGDWRHDKSVLDNWFWVGSTVRTSEPLLADRPVYQVYPKPIVLIRAPSFVHYGTAGTAGILTLWYATEKVSDKDLLELMVKDHA